MYTTIDMRGIQNEILELAVRAGVAKNKTDALGVAVLQLNDKYGLLDRREDIEDSEELRETMRLYKSGKVKAYSEHEWQELKKKL